MIESRLDLAEPELSKRDQLIEAAYLEYDLKGECLGGEVSRKELLNSMEASIRDLTLYGVYTTDKVIIDTLKSIIEEYSNILEVKISKAVDNLLYEDEIKGL